MTKTFEELGYKIGDTVRCTGSNPYFHRYNIGDVFTLELNIYGNIGAGTCNGSLGDWELVCDPSNLTWGDMTPEQQGALLLAHHQGKTIELISHASGRWVCSEYPLWTQDTPYRIKHEPVVVHNELHSVLYEGNYESNIVGFWRGKYPESTHVLTYDTEDGVPVCSSVKLSKLT
jgi:hypothetical protein